MKIYEHKVGTVIRVLSKTDKTVYYETEIVPLIRECGSDCIVVKPIRDKNGDYVNFADQSISIEIQETKSSRVYRYNNCKWNYSKSDGNTYLVIYSKRDVSHFNRRFQYRIPFQCSAKLQLKKQDNVDDCFITDISINGAAISVRELFEVGTNVSISFIGLGESIEVEGLVVRCTEISEGYYTIGVKIPKPSSKWIKFIGKLQKEELAKRRGLS